MFNKKIIKNIVYFSFLAILAIMFALLLFAFVMYIIDSPRKWTIIVLSVLYIINISSIVFVFLQHRNSQSKLSWICVMVILPFLGQLLFLIFGRKYPLRKSELKYYKDRQEYLKKDSPHQDELLNRFSNLTQREIKSFNSKLISDGFEFFEDLFNEIQNAKKYIFIEIFIIKKSFVWKVLKKLLLEKAKEGLEIRLIFDHFGSLLVIQKEIEQLEKAGIKITIYNKVFLPLINSNSFYRTHKKIFIIDGKTAYIGGNNISDEYIGFSGKYGYWMDTTMKIEGEIIQEVINSFIKDWNSWKPKVSKDTMDIENYRQSYELQNSNLGLVIDGGPDIDFSVLEVFLLQLISGAKKSIKIFSPYLIPTQRLFLALKEALLVGVEVEIYIPGLFDKKYVKPVTIQFAKQLQFFGAKIFEYNNIFAHSKSLIIDNEHGYIGTMNLDFRSLFSQYEINILSKGSLINDFIDYVEKLKNEEVIKEISLKSTKKSSLLQKLIIEIFKPLL